MSDSTAGDADPGWPDLAGRLIPGGHLLPVRVYYEDTDFSGFVYHASHVKFFERGRTEFLRMIDISHSALLTDNLGLVVRRMEIDWKRPARIDDALTVRTRAMTAKGARMTLIQTLERADGLISQARVETALIDLGGRPVKLPPDLAAKMAPWLQSGLS